MQPLVNTVANAEPIDPATEAILQFGYSGVADLQGASVLEFQGASVLEFEDELIQELQGASVLEFQDEGVPEFQGASVLEFGMNILGTTGADETVLHSSIGSLLWPAVIRPTTRYFFFLDLDRSDATGAFPLDRVNPTDAPNNFPGRANFTGGGEVAEESGVDLIAQVVLKQSCPGQVLQQHFGADRFRLQRRHRRVRSRVHTRDDADPCRGRGARTGS